MARAASPLVQAQFDGVGGVDGENLLHLPGHVGIQHLDVDLVVPEQAEPVHVRRSDGRPLPVDGGRLGVHHRIRVEEQPYAAAKQLPVVTPGQPVGDDVIRAGRHDDPYVHPPAGRPEQGRQHVDVGDEVRVRQVDVMRCAVDGLQVHAADGVHGVLRDVAVHPDVRLPVHAAPVGQGGAGAAPEEIPIVDEGVAHVPDDVAGEPRVGVPPVGRVQRADVVAADEGGVVVDDQELPVVAAGVAREPEAADDHRVPAHPDVPRKGEERSRHDEVGEAVEHDVDVHAAIGGFDQGPFERLPDGVGLPNEGLEEDLLLGLLDGAEHVVVEVLTVGVDRHLGAPGGDRTRWQPGEDHGRSAALAPLVDQDQRHQGAALDGRGGEQRALDDLAPGDPAQPHGSTIGGEASRRWPIRFATGRGRVNVQGASARLSGAVGGYV